MNVVVPAACALAAITGLALLRYGRKQARRCQCGYGLPEDGEPLEAWEWDEMDRIQAFYADTADEPAPERTWWWS